MDLKNKTDEELAECVKEGNGYSEEAFRILYERHCGKIYGYSLQLLRNKEDAENLSQDVFMKFYSNIHRYKNNGKKNGLRNLLFTIAHNEAINELRKRKKYLFVFLDPRIEGASLEKSIIKNNTHKLVRKERDSLKEKYSIPLKLSSEGWKYKEIADELNEKIGTIKSQIFHGKKKLKEILMDKYGRDSFYNN